MKHVRAISQTPARAALWQEILCQLNAVFALLLSSFGTGAPFTDFLSAKCDLPS